MKTFYEILGVQRDASRHEIREAFLQAAQAYHPDLQSGEFESDRQFKQIRRVYEVLNDPNKRRLYDQKPFLFPLGNEASWENTSPLVTSPSNVNSVVNFGMGNYPERRRRSRFKVIAITAALGLCLGLGLYVSLDRINDSNEFASSKSVVDVNSKASLETDHSPTHSLKLDQHQRPEPTFSDPEADRRQPNIDLHFQTPPEFEATQAGPIEEAFSTAWDLQDKSLLPPPMPRDTSVDRDAWMTKAKVADDALPERLQIQGAPLPEMELPELETSEFHEFAPLEITASMEAPMLPLEHQTVLPEYGNSLSQPTTPGGFGYLPTASRESLARDFVKRFNRRHSIFDRNKGFDFNVGHWHAGQQRTSLPSTIGPVSRPPTAFTPSLRTPMEVQAHSPSSVGQSPMPRSPVPQGKMPNSPTIGRAHQPATPLLPPSLP